MKARNTVDEMFAVIQAAKGGKQIQYWFSQYGNFAEDGTWINCVDAPVFNFSDYIYRVKPEPKKVPLAQADIPLDRPVWIKHTDGELDLIIGINDTRVRSWYTSYSYESLYTRGCSISFDGGKTWQPCWKEVTE